MLKSQHYTHNMYFMYLMWFPEWTTTDYLHKERWTVGLMHYVSYDVRTKFANLISTNFRIYKMLKLGGGQAYDRSSD
jgi:hypothetical protein